MLRPAQRRAAGRRDGRSGLRAATAAATGDGAGAELEGGGESAGWISGVASFRFGHHFFVQSSTEEEWMT